MIIHPYFHTSSNWQVYLFIIPLPQIALCAIYSVIIPVKGCDINLRMRVLGFGKGITACAGRMPRPLRNPGTPVQRRVQPSFSEFTAASKYVLCCDAAARDQSNNRTEGLQ